MMQGSPVNPDTVIEDHGRLVWLVLHRWRLVGWPDTDDLLQEGRLALWRAAQTFDTERGSWTSYAVRCIENGIRTGLRRRGQPTCPWDREDDDGPAPAEPWQGADDQALEAAEWLADWAQWSQRLSVRQRRVLTALSRGLDQREVALREGVSQAQVSRIRRRALAAWRAWEGEDEIVK